jgi:two-component system nitrogen regulation response regulator GlnG
LTRHFLKKSAQELGVESKRLAADTQEFLAHLPWPGNVRQLENTCRWLTVMAPGQTVRVDDLPPELRATGAGSAPDRDWEQSLRSLVEQQLAGGRSEIFRDINERFERILMEAALKATGGRKQDAAKRLGWGRNTLTRKLQEYDM